MHPGGWAGAHRHFPSDTGTRVCVCVCASLQEQAAAPWLRQQLGPAGSRNLQGVQGRILAVPRSRRWNVQYRLQKLTSSTVLIWLRVLLCPMSLVQCALLSCARAPLLNPLLVFCSVCLFWVLLSGTCRHESGGTHLHFSHGAQLATLVNSDGFALPRRWWFVARLLLAASSGYICDPRC